MDQIKELINLLKDVEVERVDCENKLNALKEQESFYLTQLRLALRSFDTSATHSPVAKKIAKTT